RHLRRPDLNPSPASDLLLHGVRGPVDSRGPRSHRAHPPETASKDARVANSRRSAGRAATATTNVISCDDRLNPPAASARLVTTPPHFSGRTCWIAVPG